jgi:hypothetical protein
MMSLKKELDDCGVCNSCGAHDGLYDYNASEVFGARDLADVTISSTYVVLKNSLIFPMHRFS